MSPEAQGGFEQQPGTNPEVESRGMPRIYVASLSDYNAGRLHGDWIDAAQEPEDLHSEITQMLATSPEAGAEEWAIHDFENFGQLRLGEWESIEHISRIGQGIAEHGPAFAAWADLLGSAQWDELEHFNDAYLGEWDSELHYAETLLEDIGISFDEIGPEMLRPYISIDMDAFARDLAMDHHMVDSDRYTTYVFRTEW